MISRILETKRQEVESLRRRRPGPRDKPVLPPVFDGPLNIIGELKRKSPSAGFIGAIDRERIRTYSRYAAAISVLTDRAYFGGSLEFLAEVAGQTGLPLLCKDFIIDPVQIDLAYAAGADMVLLIARILSKDDLESLYFHACRLGLACLVEIHSVAEIDALGGLGPRLIGVNARDLDTLRIDLDCAALVLSHVEAPVKIAESGIRSRRDMARFGKADAYLVGEVLMRSTDVERTFRELLYG